MCIGLFVVVSHAAAATRSPRLDDGASAAAPATRVDPPRTLTVTAGGDVLTTNSVLAAGRRAATDGERYDFGPMYEGLRSVTAEADLSICHMELPVGRPGAHVGYIGVSPFGGFQLIAPFEMAIGIRAAGFDRCSTASNHDYDAGVDGINSTLDSLDAVGLSHTGTARVPSEALPDPFTVNGVSVAHLSYSVYNNNHDPQDAWRHNHVTSPDEIAADVHHVRGQGAELVIVSIHLSQEMLRAPTVTDRLFATRLIAAADVDLIVHHGPHVVQPVEVVDGTLVYWSVGNMMSGMGVSGHGRYEDKRTLDGLMATVEFLETSNGWTARPMTVAMCTDPWTRLARAASAALADPSVGLTDRERRELEQCLARTRSTVDFVR